ncbi:hypothetical protein AP9108_33635 [Arthrospira sp. PCC 9108]|nr:hypothetical protein AP9108_33635 [Arthrospira sp. PCC 9108]
MGSATLLIIGETANLNAYLPSNLSTITVLRLKSPVFLISRLNWRSPGLTSIKANIKKSDRPRMNFRAIAGLFLNNQLLLL